MFFFRAENNLIKSCIFNDKFKMYQVIFLRQLSSYRVNLESFFEFHFGIIFVICFSL